MMSLFSFYAALMECLWLSTFIPDIYSNTTTKTVVSIIGISLGIIFCIIANLFEDKLKKRIEKLEDKINKENS